MFFFAFPKKILLFNSVTGFLQGGSGFIESGCPYIQAPFFGILLTRVFFALNYFAGGTLQGGNGLDWIATNALSFLEIHKPISL